MNLNRYIIGHKYEPRIDPKMKQALDSFVAERNQVRLVRRTSIGRYVLEMTEEQQRELTEKNPTLIIEEDEKLHLPTTPGLPPCAPKGGRFSLPVVVVDVTTGKGIPHVTIYGVGPEVAYLATTDGQGKAVLRTYEPALLRVIAFPRDAYWSRVFPDVSVKSGDPLLIKLKPLISMGAFDWGHRLMGFRDITPCWKGNGIKIGIIDTGMSNQHPDLKPSGGYNALARADSNAWNEDKEGHGTHLAGIIAGNNENLHILGGAPNAQVYALKVFPDSWTSDLVEAVEWCIINRMDIINIGLGTGKPSRILAGVLTDARNHGITCVAPAGDHASHVAYPAAFPTVISVGALGRSGVYPHDSIHALQIGRYSNMKGDLFAANFSNFGPRIDFLAPGVALLSTVPSGYAVRDGTSMASALITAFIALLLEANPQLRTGNYLQPDYLLSLLKNSAIDLGIPAHIQGKGLPLATRVLSAVRLSPQYLRR